MAKVIIALLAKNILTGRLRVHSKIVTEMDKMEKFHGPFFTFNVHIDQTGQEEEVKNEIKILLVLSRRPLFLF